MIVSIRFGSGIYSGDQPSNLSILECGMGYVLAYATYHLGTRGSTNMPQQYKTAAVLITQPPSWNISRCIEGVTR